MVDVLTILTCIDPKSASWFDQWVMEIALPAGTLMAVEMVVQRADISSTTYTSPFFDNPWTRTPNMGELHA